MRTNKKLLKFVKASLLIVAVGSGSFGLWVDSVKSQAKQPATPVKPFQDQDLYKRAKQDLPENYYVIYRIIDQISRANGLDNQPWRVQLTSQNNVNASASEYNLLTFEGGILEQLQGNSSALACVVAHEMGHHKKQHLGFGPAQKVEAEAKANVEAQAQKEGNRNSAQATQDAGGILGILAEVGGNYADPNTKNAVTILGRTIQQGTQANPDDLARQDAEIDQATQEKIQQEITAINHSQEFEADELGYMYSVTAGFKPEGCLQAMDILGRGFGAHGDSDTHPAVSERVEKFQALMAQYPPSQLQAQGKIQLTAVPTPLPYENFSFKNTEGATVSGIKIAPKTGSTLNDLDSTLGK